ncbi:MAG: hypothetical protein K6U03_12655 [Firmicutes bacterium]|nr:hypothetical protein [Bacillota bacterium]
MVRDARERERGRMLLPPGAQGRQIQIREDQRIPLRLLRHREDSIPGRAEGEWGVDAAPAGEASSEEGADEMARHPIDRALLDAQPEGGRRPLFVPACGCG